MAGFTQESPYSVSLFTVEVKSMLEAKFPKFYIEGEISGFKRYSSGHVYFTLKDEGAQIQAVMFSAYYERCRQKNALKDGAKVLLYAGATVYPQRSTYQLKVYAAKLQGTGDLMQRYLELKEKLEKEGLFAATKKRPLPMLPRRIGIVTSPDGAVIHDMCRVLTRRFPNLNIRLHPALVSGEEAPASLMGGLEYFNNCPDWRADLLIIGRGGGSFEDLFCFNDEQLVRMVASSHIPIISAVGHETDFTLCDFAADKRAGTPSIAAEIAVPLLGDLREALKKQDDRMSKSLLSQYENRTQYLDTLGARLAPLLSASVNNAEDRLKRARQALNPSLRAALHLFESKLDYSWRGIQTAWSLRRDRLTATLNEANAKLDALSPYKVLKRGYSITVGSNGEIIKTVGAVHDGDRIVTRLGDGAFASIVKMSSPNEE